MVIDQTLLIVIGLILLALAFDFVNGFHDAANSISTVVSTRVLSPRLAVLLAAIFNFVAFFAVGAPVAKFIGGSIISSPLFVGNLILELVFAALVGAIFWDLVTWYLGLPSSSSHALIGGLVGSGIAAAGVSVVKIAGLEIVIEYMVLSPIIGLIVAFCIMVGLLNLLKKLPPATVNKYFKKLQIISSSAVSFSHGSNDAQKTMGIITFLLIGTKYLPGGGASSAFQIPLWVALLGYSTIALGTFIGGWRIIRTMGMRITHLDPVHGFAAETTSAAVIFGASLSGIPVSTHSRGIRIHHGGGFHQAILRGTLGSCEADCVGMDYHNTDGRFGGGRGFPSGEFPFWLNKLQRERDGILPRRPLS